MSTKVLQALDEVKALEQRLGTIGAKLDTRVAKAQEATARRKHLNAIGETLAQAGEGVVADDNLRLYSEPKPYSPRKEK